MLCIIENCSSVYESGMVFTNHVTVFVNDIYTCFVSEFVGGVGLLYFSTLGLCTDHYLLQT